MMNTFKRIMQHVRPNSRVRGNLDAHTVSKLSGWAAARDGADVEVEAWLDGTLAARSATGGDRPDVELSLPDYSQARSSGFSLDVPEDAIPTHRVSNIKVIARAKGLSRSEAQLAMVKVAGDALIERLASATKLDVAGPFPSPVIDVVAAFKSDYVDDLRSAAGQKRFIDGLREILVVPSLRETRAIADYVRYLQAVTAHFAFVERFFPTANPKARPGSADFHGKPNSVSEILSIAHHLYVLRSHDVTGDFAEFGCFKGFSSAMLSFACQQLGLRMHVFDSFEGLPEADGSGYTKGDYAGSLEEVTENVRRLGAIEQVTFHKGFYADTFRDYRPPKLMCLWMDVDLEVSAKDLIVVADQLDPQAALFSHECVADMFQNGEVVTSARPDNPIPPVLERFEELGRPLTGHFLCGHTAALWPRESGIPVLQHESLTYLLSILRDEVFE
ncbi:TylF/MycF/NovP-related O-methyltransferase [Erythrobacter rubeus]|uniref:Class I SAM-dependent methyltransferase n=1 Tax=Erythrobacter rubeus TaxID=2760803 RepID=A0ABR8KNU6_9SPHN|nr:TylF/MycF/NovP-related O-methyltransferase [Erythrobacter rubeus]MBD2840982.1 class I SAM-dependent methyltransferase [Erythrobacter rubeus]